MKIQINSLPFAAVILIALPLLFSCVPARKFQDVQTRNEILEQENKKYLEERNASQETLVEVREELEKMIKMVSSLQKDTADFGLKYRKVQALNEDLNQLNAKVTEQYQLLLDNSSKENSRLTIELNEKQNL